MMNKEERRAKQRIDDKYTILLQELRVSQTGVQVLFAFLLVLPFQARFVEVEVYHKWIYLVSLLSATFSAILFIAPVTHHQHLSGQGLKYAILESSSVLGRAALFFLLTSMMTAVFLVSDVIFDLMISIPFTLLCTSFAVVVWYLRAFKIRSNSVDSED